MSMPHAAPWSWPETEPGETPAPASCGSQAGHWAGTAPRGSQEAGYVLVEVGEVF